MGLGCTKTSSGRSGTQRPCRMCSSLKERRMDDFEPPQGPWGNCNILLVQGGAEDLLHQLQHISCFLVVSNFWALHSLLPYKPLARLGTRYAATCKNPQRGMHGNLVGILTTPINHRTTIITPLTRKGSQYLRLQLVPSENQGPG